eukprot:TRINITY_DN44152_c0_g1_i1.p1 TRINITY_DN44152_c0_g1~~TRINITY_DN44152_c0_g1_i1.p1  ORF type:complete len:434 (-),score=53.56 TRINITY_DN44152_c0_g1_i1:95-1396(-)
MNGTGQKGKSNAPISDKASQPNFSPRSRGSVRSSVSGRYEPILSSSIFAPSARRPEDSLAKGSTLSHQSACFGTTVKTIDWWLVGGARDLSPGVGQYQTEAAWEWSTARSKRSSPSATFTSTPRRHGVINRGGALIATDLDHSREVSPGPGHYDTSMYLHVLSPRASSATAFAQPRSRRPFSSAVVDNARVRSFSPRPYEEVNIQSTGVRKASPSTRSSPRTFSQSRIKPVEQSAGYGRDVNPRHRELSPTPGSVVLSHTAEIANSRLQLPLQKVTPEQKQIVGTAVPSEMSPRWGKTDSVDKTTSTQVRYQVAVGGKWCDFDDEACQLLRDAEEVNGPTAVINMFRGSTEYEVDLSLMEQTNLMTGRVRQVRRHHVHAASPSAAAPISRRGVVGADVGGEAVTAPAARLRPTALFGEPFGTAGPIVADTLQQ